ncbi:MAG: hypothetical protein JNJ57_10825 [Saprospiraceae bacterium]|nr:hypothetical protein [Saprospiraceae bacterium]
MVFEERKINLATPTSESLSDLYFVFENASNQGQGVIAVDWIRMDW